MFIYIEGKTHRLLSNLYGTKTKDLFGTKQAISPTFLVESGDHKDMKF